MTPEKRILAVAHGAAEVLRATRAYYQSHREYTNTPESLATLMDTAKALRLAHQSYKRAMSDLIQSKTLIGGDL